MGKLKNYMNRFDFFKLTSAGIFIPCIEPKRFWNIPLDFQKKYYAFRYRDEVFSRIESEPLLMKDAFKLLLQKTGVIGSGENEPFFDSLEYYKNASSVHVDLYELPLGKIIEESGCKEPANGSGLLSGFGTLKT